MCSPVFWKFVGFVCFCLSHLDVSPLGAEDSLIRSAVELHFFMWLRDVPTPCTVRTSFPNPCAVAPPLSSVQGVSTCQSFRGSFCRPLGETLPTEPPEGSRPVLLSSWRRVWTPVCVPVTPRDEPRLCSALSFYRFRDRQPLHRERSPTLLHACCYTLCGFSRCSRGTAALNHLAHHNGKPRV